MRENFKGLSQSTTPFGKRKFIRIVELKIPEAPNLSILKKACENYLLRIMALNLV